MSQVNWMGRKVEPSPWSSEGVRQADQQAQAQQQEAYSGATSGGMPNFYTGGAGSLQEHVTRGGDVDVRTLAQYMPKYKGIQNDQGQLFNKYKYNAQQIGDYGGLQSYDKLRGFATGSGPSDYYKGTAQLIDQNANRSLDSMRRDNMRGLQGGISSLATSGGIDSGSRERLARGASMDRMNASQSIYGDAAMGKTQASIADSQMRLGALQNVTGMDTNRMNLNTGIVNNMRMTNTNNRIGDLRGKSAYELEAFGKIGDFYGSDKTSVAMQRAAEKEPGGLFGGGGFMGLGFG